MATKSNLTPEQERAILDGITMMPASATPPSTPIEGMIYHNQTDGRLYVYAQSNGVCQWIPFTEPPKIVWMLFIDDLRAPADAGWGTIGGRSNNMEICRTNQAAIDAIDKYGLPERISFDHDLGEGQASPTVVMWHLINGHMDGKWDCKYIKEVQVHSANPVGAKNLLGLWRGFCSEFDLVMDTRQVVALEPK